MQLVAEQVVIISSLTNAQNQEIEDRIKPMGIGTKLVPYTIGINSTDQISNNYKPNYVEQQHEIYISTGGQINPNTGELYGLPWNQTIFSENVAERSIHTIEAVALNNNVLYYGLNHTGRSNSLPLIWYTATYVEPRYFALEPVLFNESMYSDSSNIGFQVGDKITPIQDIEKTHLNLTLYEGTIYEVISINPNGYPKINSEPTAILSSDQQALFILADFTPHPDNGFYTGESYSYIIDSTGSPVVVGLKFTIDLDLYQTDQGQVFGERKGAIQFSDFKIWANNEYGTENWLRTDNDWFQLNTFAYGSNDLTQNQINQFAYQTRTFEIGDPIEETANFTCTLGFNKVPKRNPRNYGGTYYSYEYRDIVFPISWHLE